MKVKLAPGKIMAGPNGTAQGGDVIEVSAEEGAQLVETGQAELVEADQPKQEVIEVAAMPEAPETAEAPKRVRRRKQ